MYRDPQHAGKEETGESNQGPQRPPCVRFSVQVIRECVCACVCM